MFTYIVWKLTVVKQMWCLQLWCYTVGALYFAATMGRNEPNASCWGRWISTPSSRHTRGYRSRYCRHHPQMLANVTVFSTSDFNYSKCAFCLPFSSNTMPSLNKLCFNFGVIMILTGSDIILDLISFSINCWKHRLTWSFCNGWFCDFPSIPNKSASFPNPVL